MPCYHPIYMARSTKGLTKNGKVAIVSRTHHNAGKGLALPCGRCIGCRLERSRQWAVRGLAEAQMHEENSFITMTYRDEDLKYGGAEHGILVPRDFTLFFKRLRKHLGRKSIRYFGCGEYGDKSSRPHYHAVVFGHDFPDKKHFSTKNGNNLYTSDTLDDIWGHGNCIIGDVTFDSIAYVARYVMKKQVGKNAGIYDEKGITPEFVRMSRRPGLGATWLQKYMSDVYPRGSVISRGHECKPPKYYDKIFESINPQRMEEIRKEREKKAQENYEESDPKRLRVRETVKKAAIKSLKRNLE